MTNFLYAAEVENAETAEPVTDQDTVETILAMVEGVELVEHGLFAGNVTVTLTKPLEDVLEDDGYVVLHYGPYTVTIEMP